MLKEVDGGSTTVTCNTTTPSVLVGNPVNIICIGVYMTIADIVWSVPGSGPIYIQSSYYGSSGLLYNISNSFDNLFQTTTSFLNVYSVGSAGSFTYTMSCNTYKNRNSPVCDSTATSSVTITGYTTTTTTTTTPLTTNKFAKVCHYLNASNLNRSSGQSVVLALAVLIWILSL